MRNRGPFATIGELDWHYILIDKRTRSRGNLVPGGSLDEGYVRRFAASSRQRYPVLELERLVIIDLHGRLQVFIHKDLVDE